MKNHPQLERYFIVGPFIFMLSYIQYHLIYDLLADIPMCAGTAWLFHFIIGTIWTHAVHRRFTFRNAPQLPYVHSLIRTYGLFAIVLAVSTLTMIGLCDIGGINATFGWLVTTMLTSICNFVIMSRWSICRSSKDTPDGLEQPHPDYETLT